LETWEGTESPSTTGKMNISTHENGTVQFCFNHSPSQFFLSADLAEHLGDVESQILGFNMKMTPRKSSLQHPWTLLDWQLLQDNHQIGGRYWVYKSRWISGCESHYGYGYHVDSHHFQFCNPQLQENGYYAMIETGEPVFGMAG
jgi:hypothetical protein